MIKSERYSVVSPAPRDQWRAVLAANPHSLVSQSPEMIDAICASTGMIDVSRLYVMSDGSRLIVPLVRSARLPAALSIAASPPSGWGFGGIITERTLQAADITTILNDLARLPYLGVWIRPNPLNGAVWAEATANRKITRIPRRAHVLDLESGDYDYLFKHKFRHQARNGVRQAERAGLTVETDTTGRLIPVYYDLYLQSLERWARDWGEPVPMALWRGKRRDPLHKLTAMAKNLGAACRVTVAWLDGQPAAAGIVLIDQNLHYTRNVMNKDLAGPSKANYLLEKLAVQAACDAGCRWYHLGESGESESLARYKERFGAEPYIYAEYRLERLPLTQMDAGLRGVVKRMIGFKMPQIGPHTPPTATKTTPESQ